MSLSFEPEELQYKKIYKVPSVITGFNEKPDGFRPTTLVALLDTETTGLDTSKDEVIELGYLIIEIDDEGRFYDVVKRFNQLQQPSTPLSPEITEVTGLTDEDLEGHSINWSEVESDLDNVSLIVAHNAGFDRKMMERYSQVCKNTLWGCSVNDIDWKALGQKNRSQEWLVYAIGGCYYDAHRALDDVNALSLLLSRTPDGSDRPVFYELLQRSQQDLCIIKATGSHFDEKDALKAIGYRWNTKERVWYKEALASEFESDKEAIKQQLMQAAPSCKPTMGRVPAIRRYAV